MKTRIAVLAAFLATTSALPAQDSADAQQILHVTCKAPRIRGSGGKLEVEGRAELPDFTIASYAVHRLEEQWAGPKLLLGPGSSASGMARFMRKKFKFQIPVQQAGIYGVEVRIIDDLQRPDVLKKLAKITKRRRWTFQFNAWDDDLMKQLTPSLQKIDTLASEAMSMVERYEKACETETGFHSQAKKLEKDGNKLLSKLEKEKCKAVMPAAYNQIFHTMRTLVTTARFFAWEEGEFAGGKSYHATAGKTETHRNEPFSYPSLKRYLVESSKLAGRELTLWVLRDIERNEGTRIREVTDAINANSSHPGVAEYSEKLLEAPLEEVKTLIKVVKGE